MYSCSLFDHSNECPTNHPSTPITNMSRLNEVTHVRTSTVYRRRFHLIFIVPKMCLCMGMRKNDTVFALLMMHDLNLVWPKAHVFANIVDAYHPIQYQWYNRRILTPFAQVRQAAFAPESNIYPWYILVPYILKYPSASQHSGVCDIFPAISVTCLCSIYQILHR